jgi:hypothetical protein
LAVISCGVSLVSRMKEAESRCWSTHSSIVTVTVALQSNLISSLLLYVRASLPMLATKFCSASSSHSGFPTVLTRQGMKSSGLLENPNRMPGRASLAAFTSCSNRLV